MLKIILTAVAILLIIALVIYLVKIKERIDDFKSVQVNLINEANIKSFGVNNRVFVLGVIAIIILSSGVIGSTVHSECYREPVIVHDTVPIISADSICFNRMESLDKENILISAICEVESGDNEKCRGGGCMQITKVCVDAANKFQSKVHYEYQDVYSREKSYEIWHIIQRNCNKSGDIEKAIRLWNGGPGYTMAGTDGYYRKVMKVYNRKIDEHLNYICKQYKSLNL